MIQQDMRPEGSPAKWWHGMLGAGLMWGGLLAVPGKDINNCGSVEEHLGPGGCFLVQCLAGS